MYLKNEHQDLRLFKMSAAVYVNPTYSDNFPTTNLEALACGVPVVTYDTGGSPEAIDESTGRVVAQGDVGALTRATLELSLACGDEISDRCRQRAERWFNHKERFSDYVDLYESALQA